MKQKLVLIFLVALFLSACGGISEKNDISVMQGDAMFGKLTIMDLRCDQAKLKTYDAASGTIAQRYEIAQEAKKTCAKKYGFKNLTVKERLISPTGEELPFTDKHKESSINNLRQKFSKTNVDFEIAQIECAQKGLDTYNDAGIAPKERYAKTFAAYQDCFQKRGFDANHNEKGRLVLSPYRKEKQQ